MILQLILIQVVTFAVIVFVLRKLLYAETAKEAGRLKKLTEEFFIKEKELQTKIDLAQKEVETKLAKADEEARHYRDAKEKEADELKQAVISRAHGQAEEMLKAAVNSKEKIREEVARDIKKTLPEMAVRIVMKTLPPAALELMHAELVAEVITKINNLDNSILKTKIEKGEIFSPYPVNQHDREKIIQAIRARSGYDISLAEKDDKDLVAGIVVKLGALVIDGSLEDKLMQIRFEERTA